MKLALALMGCVLLAGCASSGSTGAATSFPNPLLTESYTPIVVSGTPAVPTDIPTDDFTDIPTDDGPTLSGLITYKVTSNGTHTMVTYFEGTSIEQDTSARVPWKKAVDAGGDFYSVDAQDADGTTISCEIIDQDGSVIDQHTSRGAYAIVSCQGTPTA